MDFAQISINKTEVPQSALDIDVKTRSNLFSWNGQFSPQFVEALLNKYSSKDDFVIDPFVGSGTTLYECSRKGLSAYGTEINASAYYMAKTYEFSNLDLADRLSIISKINSFISSLDNNILEELALEVNNNKDSIYGNVLSLLVVLLDVFNNEVSLDLVKNKWKHLTDNLLKIPYSFNTVKADRSDSRHLNLDDNTADLLVTSPPYINVFNYHQKYRRSVEALGFNVLSIAKSEFGSNRKNRGNRLLTVIQYCIDMALSMKEASRVCKNNSRMIYVVGRESKVLGYSFCNSELIYNIGTKIFDFGFMVRQERVFKNRFGQMIYEDILHFKNKKTIISDTSIIAEARNIAVEMLKDKLYYSDNKNKELLLEAINKKDTVKKSEELII